MSNKHETYVRQYKNGQARERAIDSLRLIGFNTFITGKGTIKELPFALLFCVAPGRDVVIIKDINVDGVPILRKDA